MVKKYELSAYASSSSRDVKTSINGNEMIYTAGSGIKPTETLLCALAGCIGFMARSYGKLQKFDFEDLDIFIEADYDTDAVNNGGRKGLTNIKVNMAFKTKETIERTTEFAKFIEEYCPVADTLLGTNISLNSVEIK